MSYSTWTPELSTKLRKDIIARRAYDLAFHSVDYSLEYLEECGIKTSGSMGKRIMPSIPDMPELPKEIDEAEVARKKEIAEILSHGDELDPWELHEKLCNVGLPKEQE